MPATTGSGPNFSSRNQEVSYYAQILSQLPGTYQGNYSQYQGKTWSQLYTELAASNPTADPQKLADAILGVEAAQRTGKNIQAAGNGLGKFTTSTEKAAASTNFAAGVPDPLSGMLAPLGHLAAAVDAIYQQLTKGSMWRSLGWLALGGILIVLGIVWWAKTANLPLAKEVASHVL